MPCPTWWSAKARTTKIFRRRIEILKRFRAEVDAAFPDRMLLAEVNQWPEDVKDYFGEGDECHMAFHFPLMPRMYMAIAREDRFPISDIMRQTPPIPETLPMGGVPAQSRRIDARNGDRQRARLSVADLCRGPSRAPQSRHPAAAWRRCLSAIAAGSN